jgi:hypothetical protein
VFPGITSTKREDRRKEFDMEERRKEFNTGAGVRKRILIDELKSQQDIHGRWMKIGFLTIAIFKV